MAVAGVHTYLEGDNMPDLNVRDKKYTANTIHNRLCNLSNIQLLW